MDATKSSPAKKHEQKRERADALSAELVILIKALLKEPPPNHDFATCPLCKKFGITRI